ncbi:MAG TPA: hypothetical protein VFE47_10860 [Tepidisphaeraceae bacterium]|jgi:hypothetical protein|nr:hypothetical protein [Tepidisphaeraceae bacterium]
MNLRIRGVLASVALLAGAASAAFAAPVPVSVDLTSLHAIQKYNLDDKADDTVFCLVNGVAAGKEFQTRFPEAGKTWTAAQKKLAVAEDHPVNLWKGELNDGEFAIVTVSVFQGDGKDAALLDKYESSIVAAEKKTPEADKKTLTLGDFKALGGVLEAGKPFAVGTLVKNEQAVITKIKNTFSRAKKTDHYSGLFNIVVWNDGTAVRKRLLPVGLTFGEQFGVDEKIYTKLKFTRDNVFVKDDKGEWGTDQLAPLSDDEKTIHVKMLETESIKAADGTASRKTTDYLADIQVAIKGAPVKWKLEGEETGVDDIHRYWHYAD